MVEERKPTGELASAAGAAVGIGSAATAAAAGACCSGIALGPLIVSVLGASGAVALEGLRPYIVPLLAFSAAAIGLAFWLNRRNAAKCTVPVRRSPLRVAANALLLLSALVWIGAVFALLVTSVARANPGATFATLTPMDEPFRDAFNRDRDDVRVVELVSPTCPACLDGVSKVEHALFEAEPSRRLVGLTVWVPMLQGKAENVPDAMTLATDARVSHYWDENNGLGLAYERVLPVATGPAWDVYMIYAPGIVWSGALPPKPTFWMHQLAITNAPHLDAAVFASRARALVFGLQCTLTPVCISKS